ncbi:MAG TPA: hypothetical protein VHB21_00215 [Minicystis sp.]|nr:hypothetical protein [Minicystis sp.]
MTREWLIAALSLSGVAGCAHNQWEVVSAAAVPNPVMFGPVHGVGDAAQPTVKHGISVYAPLWSERVDVGASSTTTTTVHEAGGRFSYEVTRRLFDPDGFITARGYVWEEPHHRADVVCIGRLKLGFSESHQFGAGSAASLGAWTVDAYYVHGAP